MTFKNGDLVEVWDGKRWQKTAIDALPEPMRWFSWICVSGWKGRAGPVSVRIDVVQSAQRIDDKA